MKLNRKFQLTVQLSPYSYDVLGRPVSADKGFTQSEYAVVASPYTLEFDINRNVLSQVNTATFKVYNLGPETRDKFYKDRADLTLYRQLILRAGYDGNMPIVFQGNILSADSYKNGTDIITEIICNDGGIATIAGFVNQAFGISKSQSDVINGLATQVPLSTWSGIVPASFAKVYKRGLSISGSPWQELRKLTNGRCFIDCETIYALNDYDAIEGELALVNSETGLISAPRKYREYIEAEMIFEPRIRVGQVIRLESTINRYINGTYKVTGFKHSGTISEAVSGDCKTTMHVFTGTSPLREYQIKNGIR